MLKHIQNWMIGMLKKDKVKVILAALFLTLFLFLGVQVAAGATTEQIIYDAAILEGAPPKLLVAICWVESRHNPWAYNKNDPSYGLCQLMYPTAKQMGYKGKPAGLFNAQINAKYAAKYLRWQLKRYKNNWLLAIVSYNAGSVIRNRRGRIVNFKYADKIIKTLGGECERKQCNLKTPFNGRNIKK